MGHKDMASAGARAYNGGLGAEPPAGSSPEAESLFVFGRLIMQYFAVFIRFSPDNCTPRLQLQGNQQEIGVSE